MEPCGRKIGRLADKSFPGSSGLNEGAGQDRGSVTLMQQFFGEELVCFPR